MRLMMSLFVLCLLLSACDSNQSNAAIVSVSKSDRKTTLEDTIEQDKTTKNSLQDSNPNYSYLLNGKDTLIPVDTYNNKIYWDLKYASDDNFMHRVLYDTLDKLYLQAEVVRRLSKIQDKLTAINADYHLLVYDGVRPLSVQWEMWNALDTIPPGERGKFVSNPANGSVHNYGAAVDLTICTGNRKPLDMGANYDDIRKIAYPSLEKEFLASGELTKQHVVNRQLLRSIMLSQNFANIPTEWWHFNAYSRAVSKRKFTVVKNELLPKK